MKSIDPRELAELLERLRDQQQDQQGCSTTVREVWDAYHRLHLCVVSRTPEDYIYRWNALARTFADRRAMDLKDEDIEDYKVRRLQDKCRGKYVGQASVNVEVGQLYSMLQWACGKGVRRASKKLIPYNPLSHSGVEPLDNHRESYLTEEQFRRVVQHSNAYMQCLVPIYFDLGLRNAELRLLRKTRVDLGDRIIHLTADDVKCGKRTGTGRDVPILTTRSLDCLRVLMGLSKSEWVTVNPAKPSEPLPQTTFNRWFRLAADAAKVVGVKGEQITPHHLRHSAAMNLLLRGVAYPTVKAILGWSSDRVPTKVYLSKLDRRVRDSVSATVERAIEQETAEIDSRKPPDEPPRLR